MVLGNVWELDLTFHPRTAEAEGAQALRNAQQLMRTHALSEEEVRQAMVVMHRQK